MLAVSKKDSTRALGWFGEKKVIEYLAKNGFSILEHNYRIFDGEIDIIATKKSLIIFVEVKTRSKYYFNLSDVITVTKQKKIYKTALYYLQEKRFSLLDTVIRFDVAFFKSNEQDCTYIENAFTMQEACI